MKPKTRILVVDDDDAVRGLFCILLRKEWEDVWEAATGTEGLRLAGEKQPGVVLVDVRLPDMDGMEVCRRLKTHPNLADVFVVLVSGDAVSSLHKAQGLQNAGADDYITKPVDAVEFLARMRTIVRLHDTTAALRASEQHHRRLLEILPDAVNVMNLKGELTGVNSQAVVMSGCASPGDLIGKTVFDITPPEVHARIRADMATALAAGVVHNAEYEILTRDGGRLPVEVSVTRLNDAHGQPVGMVAVLRDITERKRAGEALRAAEANYRSIVENAKEGMFQTTPDGRYRSANAALARILGHATPEELISSVTDIEQQTFVWPEKREEYKRLMHTQGSVQGFEVERLRKDGGRIWTTINGRVVRDASGAVLYYEGTTQDITERKRAELELGRTQRLQKAILDNIPDPAWLKDTQGRFLACNEALAKLYGRTQAQIIGHTVADFMPQEAVRLTREDNVVILSHQPGMFEGCLLDVRGRSRWFETILSPTYTDVGETTGTVGIARDVSERKWTEKLLHIQSNFGTFLSSAKDLKAALEHLLELTLQLEHVDGGGVYLVDEQSGVLTLAAHRGTQASLLKSAASLATTTNEEGRLGAAQAIHWQFGKLDEVLDASINKDGMLAVHTIPIQHGGRKLAVLSVSSHRGREIPLESRLLIETLAGHAGAGIARIQAEQSLAANRQLLVKTLESLSYAVFLIDAGSHVLLDSNPAATEIFGYPHDEIIGKTAASLHLDESFKDHFAELARPATEKKGAARHFEVRMRRKNGKRFPAECTVTAIRDETGEVVSWVAVVRDISDLKQAEVELRHLSQRIITAQEAERFRVARELHDGVNQIIASAKMRLLKVQNSIDRGGPAAKEILGRCANLLVQALEENRRIAHNLRPSDLDDLGLAIACRNLCKEVQSRTNMTVTCSISCIDRRLPRDLELNIFRMIQEAMNNVEKHAQAKKVKVQIGFRKDTIILKVQDDGRGFYPKGPKKSGGKGRGSGLTNIRERTTLLGGVWEIESKPKRGTIVTIRVPCELAE